MGSAFTQVYANIYILEWEQDLITYQASHKEIYGRFVVRRKFLSISSLVYRYIDDIFLTTNQTIGEINVQLVRAQNKDINIEIEPIIGTSVDYLDVTIMNENGQLKTKIYHKQTAEPYYLPCPSDHPHRYHRNIPYHALLRAARLCSNVHDFNLERLRIDVSLLLSDYPPKLIYNQFLRFFQVNHAELVLKQLDQQAYHQLHQRVLHQATQKLNQRNYTLRDIVKNPPVLQTKPWDSKVMYPQYTFESGPRLQFSQKFYSWWTKHYQYPESPVKNVQIRLISKTNRTLETLLIHKKPSQDILTRMEPTTS